MNSEWDLYQHLLRWMCSGDAEDISHAEVVEGFFANNGVARRGHSLLSLVRWPLLGSEKLTRFVWRDKRLIGNFWSEVMEGEFACLSGDSCLDPHRHNRTWKRRWLCFLLGPNVTRLWLLTMQARKAVSCISLRSTGRRGSGRTTLKSWKKSHLGWWKLSHDKVASCPQPPHGQGI